MPFFLVILFFSSFFLSMHSVLYFAAFVAQATFYASAIVGYVVRNNRLGKLKFLYIPFFYCLANAAALVAVLKLLSGTRVEQ